MAESEQWLELNIEEDPFVEGDSASTSVETDQSSARQMAVLKLIHDAGEYLRTLEQIDTIFIKPLRALLSPAQMGAIFCNFDKLVDTSHKFHEVLLTRKAERSGNIHVVGDLCKAHSTSVMGPYTVFNANKQNALATLKALADARSPAAALVASEATKGPDRDLAKLLNLPFLHLIRLDALFHRILKATPPGHDDFEAIKEAASRMHQTRESISMEVRKLESLSVLSSYEQRLVYGDKAEAGFKLMQPGRAFVREGALTLLVKRLTLSGKVKEPHPVRALVFTDLVLFVEPAAAAPEKLQLMVRPVMLGEGTVHNVPNTDNEMLLTYKGEQILLRCKDKDDREAWMRQLLEAKTIGEGTLMQTRRERAFAQGAPPPAMKGIAPKEITIPRGGAGWGFALDPTRPTQLTQFEDQGAAARSGLRALDEIIAINGVNIGHMSYEIANEILKAASGPNLRLTVFPARRRVSIPREAAGLGFSVRGTNPPYVYSIQIGGVAEAAGLKVGDALLAINEHDTAAWSAAKADEALAKGDVTLVVGTAMRALTIPPCTPAGFFTVQPTPGLPAVVVAVSKESTAWAAGLRAGDQIWMVNGKHVRGELLDSMQALLSLSAETQMLVVSTLREVAGPPTVLAEADLSQAVAAASLGGAPGIRLAAKPAHIESIGDEAWAAAAGVTAGDVVWEINGTPVVGSDQAALDALLVKHASSLRLRLSLKA